MAARSRPVNGSCPTAARTNSHINGGAVEAVHVGPVPLGGTCRALEYSRNACYRDELDLVELMTVFGSRESLVNQSCTHKMQPNAYFWRN